MELLETQEQPKKIRFAARLKSNARKKGVVEQAAIEFAEGIVSAAAFDETAKPLKEQILAAFPTEAGPLINHIAAEATQYGISQGIADVNVSVSRGDALSSFAIDHILANEKTITSPVFIDPRVDKNSQPHVYSSVKHVKNQKEIILQSSKGAILLILSTPVEIKNPTHGDELQRIIKTLAWLNAVMQILGEMGDQTRMAEAAGRNSAQLRQRLAPIQRLNDKLTKILIAAKDKNQTPDPAEVAKILNGMVKGLQELRRYAPPQMRQAISQMIAQIKSMPTQFAVLSRAIPFLDLKLFGNLGTQKSARVDANRSKQGVESSPRQKILARTIQRNAPITRTETRAKNAPASNGANTPHGNTQRYSLSARLSAALKSRGTTDIRALNTIGRGLQSQVTVGARTAIRAIESTTKGLSSNTAAIRQGGATPQGFQEGHKRTFTVLRTPAVAHRLGQTIIKIQHLQHRQHASLQNGRFTINRAAPLSALAQRSGVTTTAFLHQRLAAAAAAGMEIRVQSANRTAIAFSHTPTSLAETPARTAHIPHSISSKPAVAGGASPANDRQAAIHTGVAGVSVSASRIQTQRPAVSAQSSADTSQSTARSQNGMSKTHAAHAQQPPAQRANIQAAPPPSAQETSLPAQGRPVASQAAQKAEINPDAQAILNKTTSLKDEAKSIREANPETFRQNPRFIEITKELAALRQDDKTPIKTQFQSCSGECASCGACSTSSQRLATKVVSTITQGAARVAETVGIKETLGSLASHVMSAFKTPANTNSEESTKLANVSDKTTTAAEAKVILEKTNALKDEAKSIREANPDTFRQNPRFIEITKEL